MNHPDCTNPLTHPVGGECDFDPRYVCPASCRWRGVPHGHQIDFSDAARIAQLRREVRMAEELPNITWDEQVKLAGLVHASKNMADLGVKPLRVWVGTATCEEHPGRLEEELESDDPPTRGIKCALCDVRKFSNPYRRTIWRLIRG